MKRLIFLAILLGLAGCPMGQGCVDGFYRTMENA